MHTSINIDNPAQYLVQTDGKLPNELLLQIFPLLTLIPLIKARCVCRLWRHLVPLSDIDVIRRQLSHLYIRTISSPAFPASFMSKPRTISSLSYPAFPWAATKRPSIYTSLNRQRYIEHFEKAFEDGVIPDEMRLWIMEMPSLAGIRWIWPVIDQEESFRLGSGVFQRDNKMFVRKLDGTLAAGLSIQSTTVITISAQSSVLGANLGFSRHSYMGYTNRFPGIKGCVYSVSADSIHIYESRSRSWIAWLLDELVQTEERVEKRLQALRELKALPEITQTLSNDILLDISDWLPAATLLTLSDCNHSWRRFWDVVYNELRFGMGTSGGRKKELTSVERSYRKMRHSPADTDGDSMFERYGDWRAHPAWRPLVTPATPS